MPKPAIVIIAYNRPSALQRLLEQIANANYAYSDIPLVISIDGANNQKVISIANQFEWKQGHKEVLIGKQRLGLQKHIIQCGHLSNKYGSVILLEDDLGMSAWFYHFAVKAIETFDNQPNIAGISLYAYAITESTRRTFTPISAADNYFMQFPSSWGVVFTKFQWHGFTAWLSNQNLQVAELPNFVKEWSGQSWKRAYLSYMIDTNQFMVYPSVSLSTNYGDAGENFSIPLSLYQVKLETTKKDYRFIQMNTCHSIYNANFQLKSNPANELPISIEQAEYHHQISTGKIGKGKTTKFIFLHRYRALNYWNVLRKKLFRNSR